jgi:hypothetical protein
MTRASPGLCRASSRARTNVNGLRALLRIKSKSDEQVSAVELLKRTPLAQVEQTVEVLKKQRPSEEIRKAMVELIARAPLADFDTLKHVYLKHFGDTRK